MSKISLFVSAMPSLISGIGKACDIAKSMANSVSSQDGGAAQTIQSGNKGLAGQSQLMGKMKSIGNQIMQSISDNEKIQKAIQTARNSAEEADEEAAGILNSSVETATVDGSDAKSGGNDGETEGTLGNKVAHLKTITVGGESVTLGLTEAEWQRYNSLKAEGKSTKEILTILSGGGNPMNFVNENKMSDNAVDKFKKEQEKAKKEAEKQEFLDGFDPKSDNLSADDLYKALKYKGMNAAEVRDYMEEHGYSKEDYAKVLEKYANNDATFKEGTTAESYVDSYVNNWEDPGYTSSSNIESLNGSASTTYADNKNSYNVPDEHDAFLRDLCAESEVPYELMVAVIAHESGSDPNAKNASGASGYGQFLDGWASGGGTYWQYYTGTNPNGNNHVGKNGFDPSKWADIAVGMGADADNMCDPYMNMLACVSKMRNALDHRGSVYGALGDYSKGWGKAPSAGGEEIWAMYQSLT